MSAMYAWLTLMLAHAVLLAWPALTTTLAVHAVSDRGRRGRSTAGSVVGPSEFWIVVPALNEERVVGNTVAAALRLPGPTGARCRVLVVDDGSDDATPEVLAAIDHPRLHVLRRDPPAARLGKGEALNAAYRWIAARAAAEGTAPRHVVLGIIDGDGRGCRHLLREVGAQMSDPRVAAVQCQVRIRNRNRILGAVQDLEFGAMVSAFQALRDRLGTVGLGGNGQFTRLSSLQTLGPAPWSGCLVEDLELGLRLHLSGADIRYTAAASVTQQAVVDVRRLTRQRTRWAQGNLQCTRYLRQLVAHRGKSVLARAEILYYLMGPWLNALIMVVLLGYAAVASVAIAVHAPLDSLPTWGHLGAAAATWLLAVLFPGFIWALVHLTRLRDEGAWRLALAALAYPVFLLLGLLATYRAVARQLTGRQSWTKTDRLAEEPAPPADPSPPADARRPTAVVAR
ncbi:N-acetyl-glucosamine transferase [Pilimelia anulata]|uniref:N-acetyl-glucosamine transferase n=1 Tax=Pilimelia anulata TaxID=53371 RepID=A0A8J3B329_9ACTN|nr:glycosyltransferase [Pilimelia anulata]GGJ83131.1 N-acetyl-glucosamine transferase [Pilimelia anulata]